MEDRVCPNFQTKLQGLIDTIQDDLLISLQSVKLETIKIDETRERCNQLSLQNSDLLEGNFHVCHIMLEILNEKYQN